MRLLDEMNQELDYYNVDNVFTSSTVDCTAIVYTESSTVLTV